jgi:hypothetical protein
MQPEGLVGENEMKRNGGVGVGSIDARPAKGAGHWGEGATGDSRNTKCDGRKSDRSIQLGLKAIPQSAERRNGGGKGAGKSRVWETPYDSMSAEIPADASAAKIRDWTADAPRRQVD